MMEQRTQMLQQLNLTKKESAREVRIQVASALCFPFQKMPLVFNLRLTNTEYNCHTNASPILLL